MKVLGRELVEPFDTFWQEYGQEIPVAVELIEEGHSQVFGNQGFDLSTPERPSWADLPDDDLAYHVAHELTHIVQRQRGYPKTLHGPQYLPQSQEARIGGDIEEMVLHPPLEDLLHSLGFKDDFIKARMLQGSLNGVSQSPVPEYGTAWFFTWAFRYCELQIQLAESDWKPLGEVYKARASEVTSLGEEMVGILREVGWGTREQALEGMIKIRDSLGFQVNQIVLVLDPTTGKVY